MCCDALNELSQIIRVFLSGPIHNVSCVTYHCTHTYACVY